MRSLCKQMLLWAIFLDTRKQTTHKWRNTQANNTQVAQQCMSTPVLVHLYVVYIVNMTLQ